LGTAKRNLNSFESRFIYGIEVSNVHDKENGEKFKVGIAIREP